MTFTAQPLGETATAAAVPGRAFGYECVKLFSAARPSDTPMGERLLRAAARVHERPSDPRPGESAEPTWALRPDQSRVFDDFATFLLDAATRPAGSCESFGRIVLPPRTGKTVIAAEIVRRSGLHTAFLVPTRTLVMQTARELGARLPGVSIGVYCGEEKSLVEHGVNVATYAIVQRDWTCGRKLPQPLSDAALVFADEAHHTMTFGRFGLLREGFARGTVRVALTATPDYDDQRKLCAFFPEFIHEITVEEALTLGLLAPLRVWVAEVDADASKVRVIAGDFDEAALGRVMSGAPFARAVELFRYRDKNAKRAALVACASRQQAADLCAYLRAHRPPGAPPPHLLLGETPASEREQILRRFEAGEIDTVVQVGVLTEGWNSPRCKLLIDLAPSLSRVRATQKYFRVMTRTGDTEARIYVIVPKNLGAMPVLPTELFGFSQRDYLCGDLLGGVEAPGGGAAPIEHADGSPIQHVRLRKRIVLSARFEAPRLATDDLAGARAVLASCPGFDLAHPCGAGEFRGLLFDHPLFRGRGAFLLRWLGVSALGSGYRNWLARVLPDGAAHRVLAEDSRGGFVEAGSCRDDARRLLRALRLGAPLQRRRDEGFVEGWRALTGRQAEPEPVPERTLLRAERDEQVRHLLGQLPLRGRRVVARRFGLLGETESTLEDIGIDEQVSRERVRGIEAAAMRLLRRRVKQDGEWIDLKWVGRTDEPFRRGLPPPTLLPERPVTSREANRADVDPGGAPTSGRWTARRTGIEAAIQSHLARASTSHRSSRGP